MHKLWGLLILGGLGIGGIVVPASIITTIICPDDLIATVSALTLAIRVIGGSVGYCAYYNVFLSKFVPNATKYIGGTMYELGITNVTYITDAIELTGASLLEPLREIPGLQNETAYQAVVAAGPTSIRRELQVRVLGKYCCWRSEHHCCLLLGQHQQIHGRACCRGHRVNFGGAEQMHLI